MVSNPSNSQAGTDPLGLSVCATHLPWMTATPAGTAFF